MADQQWLIGSGESCDLLVDEPKVSAAHCRLSRSGNFYSLEDLGSTNGTFVDGKRIRERQTVQPSNQITLGTSCPMPWPDSLGAKQIVLIGRAPESDFRITQPRISNLHARFLVGYQETWVLEDLHSTNGIAIKLRGVRHRVNRAVSVQPDQSVWIGNEQVAVEDLIAVAAEKPERPLPVSIKPAPVVDSLASDKRKKVAEAMLAIEAGRTESQGNRGVQYLLWFGAGMLLAILLYVLLVVYEDEIKSKIRLQPRSSFRAGMLG
ncbi:FHA domain-containing protein FhaB [Roseimaritima multifibrata]|uniref:FHA domain-containing protein FhaB n=1 Tax=Roseimaritima multifibrata TaxID=1930274 RepID=A0A517MGP9_9BACT|nr:FHA domain-containing protein [Roseimaritima multifibrata]QDS94049.1 FHA domain-containing protein FhaB [Roseimaritima multifibrata]